jgi:uncharacterized protein YgiM (DUF1202 family)
MKLARLMRIVTICSMVIVISVSAAACGSKKSGTETTAAPSTSVLQTETTTAATTTAAIPVVSGTIAANTEPVTWVETAIDPAKVMYVHVASDFLRVRTGPDTTYPQISALTNGMAITVTAKTENNWYKMQDGYYVFGDFVSETA